MGKSKFKSFTESLQTMVTQHSPEILTGIGIAGMITTTVLAVKATPKALRLIEEEQDRHHEELKPVDVVKACWKCYIPATVTGAVSVACLVGASSVSARRNTALATAYKLSETALSEYKEKVVETIGEKKERDVRDAIAKDKIAKNPVQQQNVVFTGKGETLCYDAVSDRYFKSDIEKLRKAANNLNSRMFDEMDISLNEFYSEIGLKEIAVGADVGWNINNGDKIDLYFSAQLTEDDTPCLVMEFNIPPKYNYR